MRDPDDEYHYAFILYPRDDAVITDPPSPESAPVAKKGFAQISRIIQRCDTLLNSFDDTARRFAAEFFQFLGGRRIKLYRPSC